MINPTDKQALDSLHSLFTLTIQARRTDPDLAGHLEPIAVALATRFVKLMKMKDDRLLNGNNIDHGNS